jgi:diguanylate cyclase (GGDEF)-like protein
MNAFLTAGETARLEALACCNIRYSTKDPRFDLITRLAATSCHAPVAFISFVDADTVRLKSAAGFGAPQFARANSFCAHAITRPLDVTVVPDARHDHRFNRHSLVASEPHLWSYAGAPLLDPRGYAVGMLAVLDFVPRSFSEAQQQILAALAKEVAALLELCATVQRMEGELSEHRRYERRLEAAQRELRHSTGLLKLAASTDSLTLLANRCAFDNRLLDEIERVSRRTSPLSLLMIDIDHFKNYNDAFGHPAGDEALRAVAQLLRLTVRRIDFAARIGGDEFAVILPFTDLAGARVIAEKCRVAAEARRGPHGPLHISVGAAQLSGLSSDGSELVSAADEALYTAKFAGRNRVVASSGSTMAGSMSPHIAGVPATRQRLATGVH